MNYHSGKTTPDAPRISQPDIWVVFCLSDSFLDRPVLVVPVALQLPRVGGPCLHPYRGWGVSSTGGVLALKPAAAAVAIAAVVAVVVVPTGQAGQMVPVWAPVSFGRIFPLP